MASIRKRIFHGVAYTTLSNVSVQFFAAISFFIIINALPLKEYGLLQLLFSVLGPAGMIVMMGVERLVVADGVVFRASELHGKVRRLFTEYGFLILTMMMGLFVVSWIFNITLSHYVTFDISTFYWILVVFVGGQMLMNFASLSFEVYERFDFTLYAKSGEAILRLGCIVVLMVFQELTLETVFWSYALAKICSGIVSLGLMSTLICSHRTAIEKGSMLLRIIQKHGKWEIFGNLWKTLSDNMAPWILGYFASLEGVALFSFVQNMNTFFTSLFPVRGVLFPVLTHSITKSRELALAVATKVKKYLFLLYMAFYIAVYAGIGTFIAIVTPEYMDAEVLVKIAMLHLFVDILTLGQSAVFYAAKAQRLHFVSLLYGSISTIVTQIAFTYLWGVSGFIISWLFVGITQGLFREYLLTRYLRFSLLHIRGLIRFDEYDRLVLREMRTRIARSLGRTVS